MAPGSTVGSLIYRLLKTFKNLLEQPKSYVALYEETLILMESKEE